LLGVVPFALERRERRSDLAERAWIPMRVLLLKDVYKLGRAGDVKKVADGFGRNYLLPQGLAVLATPGALKQTDYIRQKATEQRARLNQELGSVAERIQGLQLIFPAKAGETGKLYGSITSAMIAERIEAETGAKVDRRQVDCQPVKTLGVHPAHVRLTIDLIPEITIVVHREGESPESAFELAKVETAGEEFADLAAELEAEEAAEEKLSEAADEADEAETSEEEPKA
jgi:large subunit ribosomal protein L9